MIIYKEASIDDVDNIAAFGKLLYSSDNTVQSLRDDAEKNLRSGKWADFLAFDSSIPIGFSEISLRNDYVEGTNGGPIGYVEGIYVLPEYRGQHIAKNLILRGEDWARARGCCEFASDCMLDNTDSLNFHLKIGFKEAGRNIHFIKNIS